MNRETARPIQFSTLTGRSMGAELALGKIANRHIAEHYPTTVAAGLEPRLEARGSADVWILPLVCASPGYLNQSLDSNQESF
jgi:hypothetical protein